MEKLHYKNNTAFSLVEMLAVLFIVSIIIIILSEMSVNSYDKYQERLSVNEFVSELYHVQTDSLNKDETYVYLFNNDAEYLVKYDNKKYWKKLSKDGTIYLNGQSERFNFRKGNLVSKANTIKLRFSNSSYKVIVHIDTGYITVDEI